MQIRRLTACVAVVGMLFLGACTTSAADQQHGLDLPRFDEAITTITNATHSPSASADLLTDLGPNGIVELASLGATHPQGHDLLDQGEPILADQGVKIGRAHV